MNTLKKFIHYYGPYKTVFFIDLLCAAIISLVDLAYPQILRSATKTLFTQDKAIILQALPWIAIGLFMMYVIQSFCKYYVSCQGHIMGAKMERDMRQELFEHYEELSFSYYSQNNSGQMMSKLVSDLFDISEFAHHGPENLFISLVKIVGSFIFLFLINKKLALPLIVLVILMFLFSFRQNQKMQRTFMENRKKIGDVNASLQDTLSGIRVVQSFTNEEIEKEKFQKSNHAFLVSKKDNYRCMGEFMSSNLFFQGMMYLVTLVYGGYLIANNEMSAADLAMYALYIGIFISPIQILVELMEMMQKGLSGFRRFLDVMETEPEIQDAPDAVELKDVKGRVCYEDVSFHYSDDETTVLSHVSIEIPAGKSVALVGPSGGGKTTLANLISRFFDPQSGMVKIGGVNVKDIPKEELMNTVSFVFQNSRLIKASILENVRMGKPEAAREEVLTALHHAQCDDILEKLPQGVDTVIGTKGVYLSGGEQQRIAIARVMLKNAPIIILDEATAFADPDNESRVQAAFSRLSEGKTVIMIAHRLSTVTNVDQIFVICDGRVAECGNSRELLAKDGIFSRMWKNYQTSVQWKVTKEVQ